MKQNNEVMIKSQDKSISNVVFDGLANEFEESMSIRDSLVKIPQLKLDQALSESVKGKISQPGEFSCFARGLSFGPEVNIIPMMISESASLLAPPPGAEIICSSRNLITNTNGVPCVKCPHNAYWNDWGSKEKPTPPLCKTSIDIIAIVDPFKIHQLMRISFRKNNYKAGKTLINLIKGDPRKIPFGRIYTLFSKEATGNGFDFVIINPKKIAMRALTDQELQEIIPAARSLLKSKRENNIIIEREDSSGDDGLDDIPM